MKRHILTTGVFLFLASGFALDAGAADVQAVLGKWLVRSETQSGPMEMEFEFRQEGSQLMGSAVVFQTNVPFSAVTFENSILTIEVAGGDMTFRLTGTLKDNKITGTWIQVGTEAKGNWTAERKAGDMPVASSDSVAGTWTSAAATPAGQLNVTLELSQEGEKVSGSVNSEMGSMPIKAGGFKNSTLQFDVETPGATYHIEGTVEGGKLTGKWSTGSGGESGAFTATRKTAAGAAAAAPAASPSPIEGNWNAVASSSGGDLPFPMVVKKIDGVLTGTAGLQSDNGPLRKVTFAGDQFSFEVEYLGGTYRVEATLKEGKLTGKWSAVDGSASGPWSAEKKSP